MESSGNTFRRKLRTGLLICLLLAALPVWAQSWRDYRNLVITPIDTYCFAGETSRFVLEVPDVTPDDVEIIVQAVPENSTIVSSIKEEYVKNEIRGTRVTFNIRFSQTGTYHIPAASARIAWTWLTIPFQTVTVYDNPLTLTPRVFVNAPDVAYKGEPFTISISAMHFSEISDVSVALDTEAMLERIELLNELPFTVDSFTADTYPVAVYQVIPYDEGTFNVPEVSLAVKSYSGIRSVVSASGKTVKILPPENDETDDKSISFDIAYVELEEPPVEPQLVLEHSAAEQAAKLIADRQIYKTCLWICLGFLAAFIALLSTGASFRKKGLLITGVTGAFLCVIAISFLMSQVCHTLVVSKGGELRLIPETTGNVLQLTQEGSVFRVKDESALWYRVTAENGVDGWILKQDVLPVGGSHELR